MELLLAIGTGGLIVWLIMRRNRPAAEGGPPRARSGGPGFIGWLLIISAALWGTFHFLGSAPVGTAASDPYDQTGCSASKRAIEAKLKSPGSAKWASCRVTTEAGVQTVIVAVDSQNASGGLVRSEWVAKVRDNSVLNLGQIR